MAPALAKAIFETCPFPELAALLSGFAAFDWWGQMYLTPAGEAYLAERFGQ